MNTATDYTTREEYHNAVRATVEKHGLAVTFTFVPMSQSRNRKEPRVTSNWRAVLTRNGRTILETDYSAGSAFLPGDKLPVKALRPVACKMEAESGRIARVSARIARVSAGGTVVLTAKPIPAPDALDFLACIVSDAGAVDAPDFETWAGDMGMDTDSREAERCYRACLDAGLRLRAAVGDAGLAELRAAFGDW